MSLAKQSIGNVAKNLAVSAHTLRYYEKIGLLPPIAKDTSGRRLYDQKDIARLRFIKRAQRMHFSLKEIAMLIGLDQAQSIDKPEAQKLVSDKLSDIEASLQDLKILQKDMKRMLAACKSSGSDEECPIMESIKES